MIGALAGAGLGAIGTGFQMYGAHEQHKAMADALAKYSSAHNGYLNAQDQQDTADQAYASDMAHKRQVGLTSALNDFTAAPPSGQVQADAMGQLVAQNKLKTGPAPTGAGAGWQAPLDAFGQQQMATQQMLAADKARQDAQRLAQEKALSSYHILGSKLDAENADHSGMAAIERALRDREWARQQGKLQMDMNGAQGAGGSSMMLGGILGASGGLVSAMGASNGAADPKLNPNSPQYDPNAINTG